MILFTFVHTQFARRLRFGILIKVVLIFSTKKFGLFANACGWWTIWKWRHAIHDFMAMSTSCSILHATTKPIANYLNATIYLMHHMLHISINHGLVCSIKTPCLFISSVMIRLSINHIYPNIHVGPSLIICNSIILP
jgi:hypothetical protein